MANELGIPVRKLQRWGKSKGVQECWHSRKTNRARYCMPVNDIRIVGKFWKQQREVYKMYKMRRNKGDPIDNDWFRNTMTHVCERQKPVGYDPEKDKFTQRWKVNYCRRFKISVQRKTNRKSKCVWERIHLVMNYHWYTIYQLGNEKP